MRKLLLKITLVVAAIAFGLWYAASRAPVLEPQTYGITFSGMYAAKFSGVDRRAAYIAILDDLGARHLRLPAYWSEIEPERGTYDFSDLDWQIAEAEKRGAAIILAVGRKLPRWPECHIPAWAREYNAKAQDDAAIDYIERTVERYRGRPAIAAWQVENEPFLPFGECPDFDAAYVDRAIAAVRAADARPILVTDSGELSVWIPAARRGDWFGTTMYRTVWNDYVGTFTYPLPPAFFRVKRAVTELAVGKKPMIVIELQGESWQKKQTYEVGVPEQYVSMNPDKFKDTLVYASRSGFDVFYLWGVEWWWWLKEKEGRPEMWNIAKEAIQSTAAR